MWYLQCLIQRKIWALLQASGGPLAADNLSGRGRFVLYVMYLLIPNWFDVVPETFDRMHFWATFGPMGHMQLRDPGRRPYLNMLGYTVNVPVLRYWYLVRLIKVLWAAGLYLCTRHHFGAVFIA